jgi:hypothetical protein
MKRIIFTDEEFEQLNRFAAERHMNPKEVILAMARLGNKAADRDYIVTPTAKTPATATEKFPLR